MAITRRMVLGAALALPLAARTASVRAAGFVPPVVDRVELTTVCDGSAAQFGVPVSLPGFVLTPTPRLADYHAAFRAEWSYSVLAKAQRGGRTATTLVDFGYAPETFINNLKLLGIDPATIDAMVLSHGHYDHFGGLAGLVADGRLQRGTPLYVGGEEVFCERVRGTAPDSPGFGAIDRAGAERAGVRFVVGPEPQAVAATGFTTGFIPLASPERPKVPTAMLPGHGCAVAALDPAKRGAFVVDDAAHELGTAFNLAGLGLVVIGSCSHRGIINTVRRAQAVSGEQRIHAIVGGFHLVPPQTTAQAEETVALMQALDPRFVVPGHCSGETFIAKATAAMPGRVFRAPVGTRIMLGGA